jgi:hypothetical protein
LTHIGKLKGAAFKQQKLSNSRLQGLGALGLSAWTYANYAYLTLLVGSTVPTFAIAAGAVYGALKFNYKNEISAIEFEQSGEHQGWLNVTINETPFMSKTIKVNPVHIKSLSSYGMDTQGAQETNSFIIHIDQHLDSSGNLHTEELIALLPEEAYRDNTSIDWIT